MSCQEVGPTDAVFPAPLLHEIFEKSAEDYPSNIAVESSEEGVRWTYHTLDLEATRLARLLVDLQLKPDDLVGIYLPRGAHFYLCMLATLKAGAGYVSIDPEYPADRVQHIIDDSHAKLLFVDDALLPSFQKQGIDPLKYEQGAWTTCSGSAASDDAPIVVPLNSARKWLDEQTGPVTPIGKKDTGVLPHHTAYAIFTSGSTGKPKGVCIEHRNAANFVIAEQVAFPTFHSDRVLQGFSTCFDASVEEIWLAFASGATLVVGTKELMRSGPEMGALLADRGITVFSTVPTVLRVCEDIPDPPLLRIVITGGEACPPEVVDKWCAPGRVFLNTYGPTEATVVGTYCEVHPKVPITIGKALPGYSAHIVDEEGNPCPPGSGKAGELLLGGVSVARGYINRPDLNPEKFIPDTHTAPLPNWLQYDWREYVGGKTEGRGARGYDPKTHQSFLAYEPRLYRTGDLTRFDADGNIEFLGRIDSQVKIRGYRVELTEIESALCTHPQVKEAVVLARDDVGGAAGSELTLVAYVTSQEAEVGRGPRVAAETTAVATASASASSSGSSGANVSVTSGLGGAGGIPALTLDALSPEGEEDEEEMMPSQEPDREDIDEDVISPQGLRLRSPPQRPRPPSVQITSPNDDVASGVSVPSETSVLKQLARAVFASTSKTKEKETPFFAKDKGTPHSAYCHTPGTSKQDIGNMTTPELLASQGRLSPAFPPTTPAATAVTDTAALPSSPHHPSPIPAPLLTPLGLREHVSQSVPDYMVPARYIILNTIPYMPSGKVDRKALGQLPPPGPETLPSLPSGNGDNGAVDAEDLPSSDLEKLLASAWEQALGVPQVLASDDFFKLGGNSLVAARVISKLRQELPEVPLAVRDLYDTQVLRVFASRIESLCEANEIELASVVAAKSSAAPPTLRNTIPGSSEEPRTASPSATCRDIEGPVHPRPVISAEVLANRSKSLASAGTRGSASTDKGSARGAESKVLLRERKVRSPWKVHPFTMLGVWIVQALVILLNATYTGAFTILSIHFLLRAREDYNLPLWAVIACWPASVIVYHLLNILIAVALKWTLLGKVREGEFPVWSWKFVRWWTVRRWTSSIDSTFLFGTPLMAPVLRLLGSKIGKNVHIASKTLGFGNFDLMEIGDDAVLQPSAYVRCIEVENGYVKLRKVKIGRGAELGALSFVARGCTVGENSTLCPGTSLMPGTEVPSNQIWHDGPGKCKEKKEPRQDSVPSGSSPFTAWLRSAGFLLWWSVSIFTVLALTEAPRVGLIYALYLNGNFALASEIIPALSIWAVVVGPSLYALATRWLLFPLKIQPGTWEVNSWFYCRFWLLRFVLDRHVMICHPFYSTLFTSSWMRWMGASIGKKVEVSDLVMWTPDMTTIEDECFIADAVHVGGWNVNREAESGRMKMSLGTVKVGARTFLGNNSIAPPGTDLPRSNLVGVASVAPPASVTTQPNQSYLGSVAFALPNREIVEVDSSKTFAPPLRMRILRVLIELYRCIAPSLTVEYAFLAVWLIFTYTIAFFFPEWSVGQESTIYRLQTFTLDWWVPMMVPALVFLWASVVALSTLIHKWLLVGRIRPGRHPLYSTFVWRAELMTTMADDCAYAGFGKAIAGTPFLNTWMRMMGSKIGRRVYLDTPYLIEFDLVTVGDDTTVEENATLQTHLFEDRVMKTGTVEIGREASVGTRSVVLYDTHMGDGATLYGLSLMMKGEEFRAGSKFGGVPGVPVRPRA